MYKIFFISLIFSFSFGCTDGAPTTEDDLVLSQRLTDAYSLIYASGDDAGFNRSSYDACWTSYLSCENQFGSTGGICKSNLTLCVSSYKAATGWKERCIWLAPIRTSAQDRERQLQSHTGGFARVAFDGDSFGQLCEARGFSCRGVVDWRDARHNCGDNDRDGSRVACCVEK